MRARAALLLVAALAAGLAGYDTSLHPRAYGMGAAGAKLLVDAGESELTAAPARGAARAELAARLAVTYALYLQSQEATAELGRALGLPGGERVAASGPFTLLLGRSNVARATPAASDPLPVDRAYRLSLDVDGAAPVLALYAQAPSAAGAVALVDDARALLERHVATRRAAYPLDREQAAVLRPLGPTVGGLVDPGARWQAMAGAFLLVLALGGLALLARRRRRRGQLGARSADEGGGDDGGDWPHTTRLLPWALAGFVAMLFLVPFDALRLPIGLPLDSNLDRPLLVALVALWLLGLGMRERAARPRVRLTRVHFAALAFFALCCLGVAADGAALANMGEVTLVVKKLALLASYLVFFLVVASVLRAREVPRFVALIVVLGSVVAAATVLEYRLRYDVFYEVWGRLLPVSRPPDLDAPDSIGRLTVYGPTSQPLELAALLAMVLPFAVIGAIDAPSRRRRVLYALAVGLLLAGGLATSRKTSLVAPAGALVVLLAYRPRAVGRALLGLGAALAVLVHIASPGALGSVLSQLAPGHVGGVLTTTDRTARYDAVRPDVMRHLLLGRGFASYDPHKYRILDNEYLGLLIGTGALGLAAYVAILLAIASLAHRAARDGPRASPALPALASVTVVAVASALFDVLAFPHVPYLLFFLAGAIVALHGAPTGASASSRPSVSAGPRAGACPDRPRDPSPRRTRRSRGAQARPTRAPLAGA